MYQSYRPLRFILVGPTCSGKTYLRKKMENRGIIFMISYTSRPPRENEEDAVHYHFRSKEEFEKLIKDDFFHEYTEYNGFYYGTGLNEWRMGGGFVMEIDGINHISVDDRKDCFIIYLDTPLDIRVKRMKEERGWENKDVVKRITTDNVTFKDFSDYDLRIVEPYF
jgi:guanylate kinase